MGIKRPAEDLLFRDISYQMELGYCDLKDLSDIYHKKLIKILATANLTSVQQLKGLTKKDLAEVEGIDEKGAKAIVDAVKKAS